MKYPNLLHILILTIGIMSLSVFRYFRFETPFRTREGERIEPLFLNREYNSGLFANCLTDIGEVGVCPSGAPYYTMDQAWTISSRLREMEEDLKVAMDAH